MSLDNDEKQPNGVMGRIGEFIRSWGPALFAVLFIRTYVFEPFRIPSGSMEPTLLIGDHVAVTKFSYGIWVPATIVDIPFLENYWIVPRYRLMSFGGPKRGDIIVFRFPRNEALNYIKRVVGVGGDRIRVQNNHIYVNDVEQPWKYEGKFTFIDGRCNPNKTKMHIENLNGLEHHVLTHAGLNVGRLANMAERTVPEGKVFAMGDNRDFSEDGRVWGFVRADQIKGKAHLVWLSWDGCGTSTGGIRMDRFFHNLYSLSGISPESE